MLVWLDDSATESKDMSDSKDNTAQAPIYQIRIEGHLSDHWLDVFHGLDMIRLDNGNTLLQGLVVDQAALHGLLRRIRDTGMTLISVRQV